MLHHPRQRRDRARVVLDVGARHAQHDFRVALIERDLDAEALADREQLVAIGLCARFRLAGRALVRRLLIQLLRGEAGLEHRVPRLLDQRRHIDAHRADQAAAAAHVAAVEQQMLPLSPARSAVTSRFRPSSR